MEKHLPTLNSEAETFLHNFFFFFFEKLVGIAEGLDYLHQQSGHRTQGSSPGVVFSFTRGKFHSNSCLWNRVMFWFQIPVIPVCVALDFRRS